VLRGLVTAAEELAPGMRCSVLLRSADGRRLEHGFAPSLPDDYNAAVDGLEIAPDVGSCGAAAHLGQRVIAEDVLSHPNWARYRDLATSAGIRASWSQPIRGVDGEVLGTFALYYAEPRAPEPHETELMEATERDWYSTEQFRRARRIGRSRCTVTPRTSLPAVSHWATARRAAT
jgi:GAF domain-containing protein